MAKGWTSRPARAPIGDRNYWKELQRSGEEARQRSRTPVRTNRTDGYHSAAEQYELSGNETNSEAADFMVDESKRKAPLGSDSEDGQDTEERRPKQSRISSGMSPDRRVPMTPHTQTGANAASSGTNIPESQTAPVAQQYQTPAEDGGTQLTAIDPRAAAHMALQEQMQRMFPQDPQQSTALNVWEAEGDEQAVAN